MNIGLWAEIRRLAEIEKLSGRAIARRLRCSRYLVTAALELDQPPSRLGSRRLSHLDPHKAKIDALVAKCPELSAVRIHEEITRGPNGYTGSAITVRRYLRTIRPKRGRVYQEVHYEPAQAMQVDWGECGRVRVGNTPRKVSVFVAVLCYSRLMYIEFTLSQRKAEFYRGVVHALEFFGGSPRAIIVDNLKAAVLNGSGRAACFHPEFLALCGCYCLQPIACERRDPESKGIVEGGVRYVKHNALAGRGEELTRFEDYLAFAPAWRDQVANVRIHETTRERPVDRFQQERSLLRRCRPSPSTPTRSCRPWSARMRESSSTATATRRHRSWRGRRSPIRATRDEVRMLHQGEEAARHDRCYERGQLIMSVEHRLAALALRQAGSEHRAGTGVRRLGPRGTPVPPPPEEPAGEDRRPPASLDGIWHDFMGRTSYWPPSIGLWNWRPTTPRTSRISCWRNAAGDNFPHPRCPPPAA